MDNAKHKTTDYFAVKGALQGKTKNSNVYSSKFILNFVNTLFLKNIYKILKKKYFI